MTAATDLFGHVVEGPPDFVGVTSDPSVIRIVVLGRPRPKVRHPAIVAGHARMTTPAHTAKAENDVRAEARRIMGERPLLDGPLQMMVTAYLPVPTSFSKKRTREAVAGWHPPTTRPDLDNYLKLALDSCNTVVFRDDSQVVDLLGQKRYSDRPRLEIEIGAWAPGGQ